MKTKILLIISFISLVQLFIAGGIFATESLEDDQERIREEREEVQSELSDAEISLAELVRNREELTKEISNLNDAIVDNEERIVQTEEDIKNNETALKELESEVESLQEDIDERIKILKERASSYQKHGINSVSYIEVILGSKSFGDFVSRIMTISRIEEADNKFIEQLEENQQELEIRQKEYEETLAELDLQATELTYIHANIEGQRENTIQLRDEVKSNEAEQEALIAQLLDREKNLASQEEEIRSRIEEEVRRQEEARREAERAARARAEEEVPQSSRSNPNTNNNGQDNSSSSSSSTSEEGNWLTFSATAYTAECIGCSGITSTGIDLRSNPNAKVIAVDPSVIPLGSRVEVSGYGTFLAADTGGAIKGNKIDIFMNDRSAALDFGRRSVQIRVLQ